MLQYRCGLGTKWVFDGAAIELPEKVTAEGHRFTPVMARGTNQKNVGRRGTYRAAFVTAHLYVHTGAIPTVGVGLVTRDRSEAPRSDERSHPLNDPR